MALSWATGVRERGIMHEGLIATMPYEDYLKVRDKINEEFIRGLTTYIEYKERRFMLEAKYWLGI